MPNTLFESNIPGLKLHHRGKVRDIYDLDQQSLLIVTSDRISAFDVVLPTPIPGKGAILTAISTFWFERFKHLIPNHLISLSLEFILEDAALRQSIRERSVIVRKLKPLPVEAIVRGYLSGSAWQEYQRHGDLCGAHLPRGLRQADKLPTPLFTPSTKAAPGEHDINIDMPQLVKLLGRPLATQIQNVSLEIYRQAAAYAYTRGIIIADTKFEFGLDDEGRLVLIDEVLTPDSSRFWPIESYAPNRRNPPSFDKQAVRDYLQTLQWDKSAPGPQLPPEIVNQTAERYRRAYQSLVR
jgi:phosphoribosylaminoimidazole-succinocarboxamide synthase